MIGDLHKYSEKIDNDFSKSIIPTKPYLLTTGDIIQPYAYSAYNFYSYCAKNWEKTYVMMGNQEYESHLDAFNYTMDQQFELMKQLIDRINQEVGSERLVFIQNGFVDIPEMSLRIIGLTLWANGARIDILKKNSVIEDPSRRVEFLGELYLLHTSQGSSGSPAIPITSWTPLKKAVEPILYESITKDDLADLQTKDTEFLSRMIAETSQKQYRLLVCSHYIPTLNIKKESPIIKNENVFSLDFFCRDMSEFINSPIIAWVCGHVHLEQTIIVNNIPVYVNVELLVI